MAIRPHRLLCVFSLLIASHCSPAGPDGESTGGSSTGGASQSTGGSPLATGGSPLATGGSSPTTGGSTTTTGGTTPSSGGATGGTATGGTETGGTASGGMSSGGSSATGGSLPNTGGSGAGGKGSGGNSGGTNAKGGSGGASAGGANAKGGSAGNGGAGTTSGGSATGGSGTLGNVTVYIASDSTAQTYTNSAIHQAGWGQYLQTYLDPKAKVDNRAIGGRTARRFIDEGYLDKILQVIKPGDYLLVQFGTNDGNQTATYTLNGQTIPYYLAPATDFKTWMTKYVTAARDHMANPVFVTPPPRRSCTGDSHSFGNGLASYSTAMKEMGTAQNVPVVDLNQKTLTYLNMIGCVAAGTDFFLVNADGSVDGTHFQEKGANLMAGFVATGLRELNFGLSPYVK
ncbi:MAG TPA: rhamnogalacturonan acetylesterase [Polyangiaceae bacterium]|nr:rhamnogalacturonan acetylesterase [Polyangiaceae bacterium]